MLSYRAVSSKLLETVKGDLQLMSESHFAPGVASMHVKLRKEASEQGKSHSIEAKRALRDYAQGEGVPNDELREHKGNVPNEPQWSRVHEIHKNISAATNSPTKHEFHAYRGAAGWHPEPHKLPVGHVLHDHGYASASLDHHTAGEFDEMYSERDEPHAYKIHVKPGTKGHYIGNKMENDQHEFLFHHGTSFKVTGHSEDEKTGRHFTHLEVHHQL